MRITAICGWAINKDWFENCIKQVFPEYKVNAVYPNNPLDPNEAREIINENYSSEVFIGYSLGSLWLTYHQEFLPKDSAKILISPILGFSTEHSKGGKVPIRQLKYLMQSLKRGTDVGHLLDDFFKIGSIKITADDNKEYISKEILLKGLEFLEKISVSYTEVKDFIVILGEKDPFTDGKILIKNIPHLIIISDADHNPEPLLQQIKRRSLV